MKYINTLFSIFISAALIDCVSSGAPYVPVEASKEEWDEFYKLRGESAQEDMDNLRRLPAEQKKRYADMLRSFDPDKDWADTRNDADWRKLLWLDDEVTGQYLLRQFEKHQYEDLPLKLGHWYSPKILAPIAKGTTLDDVLPEATINFGISFECSYALRNALQTVPGVPGDVRQWALAMDQEQKRMRNDLLAKQGGVYSDVPSRQAMLRMREIARAWWRANEKALTEGRLQDLKPGEHYQPELHHQTVEPLEARRIELNPKKDPPSASSPPQAPESEGKSDGNFAIYAAIASILGAIFLIYRKSLRKKSNGG